MFSRRPPSVKNALRMLMEHQVALDLEIRERAMAQQVALAEDVLRWVRPLSTFLYVSLTFAALSEHFTFLIPIVPVAVFKNYIVDFANGEKVIRVNCNADIILASIRSKTVLPGRLPRDPLKVLDRRIKKRKLKARKGASELK